MGIASFISLATEMSADAEHLRLIAYHMRVQGYDYHAEFLERLAERLTVRRLPYKVDSHIAARMAVMRAQGKSYQMIADFCGVSPSCVRKWLAGQTPKQGAS